MRRRFEYQAIDDPACYPGIRKGQQELPSEGTKDQTSDPHEDRCEYSGEQSAATSVLASAEKVNGPAEEQDRGQGDQKKPLCLEYSPGTSLIPELGRMETPHAPDGTLYQAEHTGERQEDGQVAEQIGEEEHGRVRCQVSGEKGYVSAAHSDSKLLLDENPEAR